MEGKFKIYPMHLGSLTRQKINMAYMKDPGLSCDFPLIAWYLTDGVKKVMVDTGGIPADGKRYMPYVQTPEQTMKAELERLHVNAGEIEYVILTHLHWDHIGYNEMFTNAEFFVQRAELKFAENPVRPQRGGYDMEWILQSGYTLLDGECELMKGIEVLCTPGHTPGSQSVVVDTEAGKHIILGDFIALYECYENIIPNGLHTDLCAYYDAMERIKQLKYFPLPGHERKVLKHEIYPIEE